MPMFNRKYIFNPGQFFSIAMLVYQNVVGKPFNKWKLPKLDLHQNTLSSAPANKSMKMTLRRI